MGIINSKLKTPLICLLLGILVFVVLFSQSAALNKPLSEDSGMFLYHGKQILDGRIPYRDTWEPKGPLILYINALGLLLGGGSSWGVWTVEFVFILASALIGFSLIKKVFGNLEAIFASILWILSLVFVLEGGNLTESYNLLLQFATLYLFFKSEKEGKYGFRGFFIGVLGGLSFFLRQNLIGIFLSVLAFLFLKRALKGDWRGFFRSSKFIFLGFFLVLSLVFYYFAANKALYDLIDQTFRFNLIYSNSLFLSKLAVPVIGIWILARSGISFAGFSAFVLGFLRFRKMHPIVKFALIAYPLEIVLSGISGISPPHYFITWLPSLAVLSAFFAHFVLEFIKGKNGKILVLALATSFSIPSLGLLSYIYSGFGSCEGVGAMLIPSYHFSECRKPKSQVSEYIRAKTLKDEYVLIWGFGGSINFTSGRRSPTRFTYQYPLFTPGYQRVEMINEVYQDLMTNKPVIIIDTTSTASGVPPLDKQSRQAWRGGIILPEAEKLFEFFEKNYHFSEQLGQDNWLIYKLNEEQR